MVVVLAEVFRYRRILFTLCDDIPRCSIWTARSFPRTGDIVLAALYFSTIPSSNSRSGRDNQTGGASQTKACRLGIIRLEKGGGIRAHSEFIRTIERRFASRALASGRKGPDIDRECGFLAWKDV